MTSSDSTQPEDFSSLVDTREKNYTVPFIVVGALILLAVGGYWLFTPEQEIELAPPAESAAVDPIVRAEIETAESEAAAGQATDAKGPEMASFEAKAKPDQRSPNTALASLATAMATRQPAELQTPAQPPGDEARNLIEAIRAGEINLSLDQLHGRAAQLQEAGRDTDAYLLYFYAARKGHGLSAFALAEMNDPVHFRGENLMLDKPDPVQAHKWYRVAAMNQVAAAEQRLNSLRNRVENAAAEGDVAAQRLLLNWK